MKEIILTFLTLLSFRLTAQLSEDKKFNSKLLSILPRDVNEVFAKDIHADSTIIYLDARERKEFDVSHLKNARWIGYDDFSISSVKSIPKNAKIVVYCTVGYRSGKITKKLTKAGFTKASNLVGGIIEWKNLGYSVVDESNKDTERVHTYNKSWSIWLRKGIKVY